MKTVNALTRKIVHFRDAGSGKLSHDLKDITGTRQNKIVLVQYSSISHPDTGGSYTVKKYTSKKKCNKDGTWQHEEIILKPLNPAVCKDIPISNTEDEEFMVVAEVVGKF